MSPLLWATAKRQKIVLSILIDLGANLNLQEKVGNTALVSLCVSLCIYVCIYICMYVCIYLCLYTHTYIYIYIYIYLYMFTYMYVYMHTYIYIYTFICIQMVACSDGRTDVVKYMVTKGADISIKNLVGMKTNNKYLCAYIRI
jgi:hypothetical protein